MTLVPGSMLEPSSAVLLDAEALAARVFQPLRPGVEISRLYEDAATGAAAAVLRYAPGGRIPRHRHDGYEHVFVLQGEQRDENGSYSAGTLGHQRSRQHPQRVE